MFAAFKVRSFVFFSVYLLISSIYYFGDHTTVFGDKEPLTNEKEISSYFLDLLNESDSQVTARAINFIDENWKESHEIMLLESLYFSRSTAHSNKLLKLLQRKTNKQFGFDYDKWFQWLWNKEATYSDAYYHFKAELHQSIDPKFRKYFLNRSKQSLIRLDEVRWGGVFQDGIPPLRNPKMIAPIEANYLDGNATVFGIEVNGDARAYPKQILAWHEMFVDEVGGIAVAGVYCTLCGTVILYKTEQNGVNYKLGTSGFLYRSNKLMYDNATQSLWSTLEGEPVIGPLVGKGIKLDYLSVVTTTWDEWKKRHPETKVLSLDTGYQRDYGEGVAYKDYFSTDNLMFTIPKPDRRLKNKDEILAIRLPKETKDNIAISSKFLKKNTIYSSKIAHTPFTVFTDKTGAHRVYKTKGKTFTYYDEQNAIVDINGNEWKIKESELVGPNEQLLERLPSHNAFWFGYQAAFPDVILIK